MFFHLTHSNLKTFVKSAQSTNILISSIGSSIKFKYSTSFKKDNTILIHQQQLATNKKKKLIVVRNYSSSTIVLPDKKKNYEILDPLQYNSWTKEQVCSLLVNRGLTLDDVKPLYDAGFDGCSLSDIVTCIQDKDEFVAFHFTRDSFPTVAPATLKSVVKWVDNLLNTRLYHLWSAEQFGNHLIEVVGLSENQARDFIAGKKSSMFFKDESTLSLIDTLENEVQKKLINSLRSIPVNYIEFETKTYQPFKYTNNKITLTKNELRLLKEIEELELKDLSNAKYGMDRLTFNLHNRDETEKEIIELAIDQYNVSQKEQITKQELKYMIFKGISGCGKTRLMYEVPNMLKKAEPAEIFDNTSIIYYNFTNEMLLQETGRDQHLVSMISSRICYSAFEKPPVYNMPKILNDCFLYELFNIISRKLHKQLKVDPSIPIPLVIAVDQYQYATRFFQDLKTQLMSTLGFYMKEYQKSQGLILFPILGAPVIESDDKLEPTNYSSKIVSIPLFRPEDVKSIIEKENLQSLYTPQYRAFWNLVGVIPRHLEWAIEQAKSENETTAPLETKISNIYKDITKKVYERFLTEDYQETFSYLANLTLSGYKYNSESYKYDTKVDQYEIDGRIYKFKDYMGLPPPFLDKFAHYYDSIPRSFLKDLISNKTECEKFQEICLKTITCKLNYSFKFKSDKHLTVYDIFQGAHIPTSLMHMPLKTQSCRTNYFKYETDNNTINDIIRKSYISTEFVTKSKKSETGIDGFLPQLLSAKKKILFVTQNKFLHVGESQDETLVESELKSFYENALMTVSGYKVIVIMFTNKRVSQSTAKQIKDGKIGKNLIVVSGDCFKEFFNPFIANVLAEY